MKLLQYDEWVQSASLQDGISVQNQIKIRFEMYSFARELEACLKNGDHPIFQQYFQKALSCFHRFSHQISFRHFDRYLYMVACLFLAAKDEDMFNWAIDRYVTYFLYYCANRKDLPPQPYQKDVHQIQLPRPQILSMNPPTFDKQLVKTYSQKICDAESHILKMLGYDLDIIVPQYYFLEAKKKLKILQGDSEKFWAIAQKFLTDLFITNQCLYYQPKVNDLMIINRKILALSAIHQTQIFLKVGVEDLPDGIQWYAIFDNPKDEDLQQQTTMETILGVQKQFDETIKTIKY